MQKLNIKRYEYFLEIFLLLTGILIFILFSGPIQFIGLALFCIAYVYLVYLIYSKLGQTDEENFKSRIHDAEMKFHNRK
jgi:Ca2+/Na+ antiporter